MTEENQSPPFEFGIARILDCGFLIDELESQNIGKMQVGYGMDFLFDVEESWIQYNIRADFRYANTNHSFITGTVLTRFSVNNLKDFVDETEKVIFPKNSVETLFGIAFSHLRAILSKNLAGSRFSHIYLPPIDPNIVFTDLLKLNIDKFNEWKNSNPDLKHNLNKETEEKNKI